MAESRPLSVVSRLMPTVVSVIAMVVTLLMGGLLWQAVSPRSQPTGLTALISNATVAGHLEDFLIGPAAREQLQQSVQAGLATPDALSKGGMTAKGTAVILDRVVSARRSLAQRLVEVVFPESLRICLQDVARVAHGKEKPGAIRTMLGMQLNQISAPRPEDVQQSCRTISAKPEAIDNVLRAWVRETKASLSEVPEDLISSGITSKALLAALAAGLERDISPETMNTTAAQAILRDTSARYIWAGSAMLFSGIWIASVIVGLHQLFVLLTPVDEPARLEDPLRRVRARQIRVTVIGGTSILAVVLGVMIAWMSFEQKGGDLPNELLGYFAAITQTRIVWWANIFSGLAGAASFVLIVCAWAPLWLGTPDGATLARQVDALRLVLNMGTALLVSALIEIAALFKWPAALIADAKASETLASAATAGALYAGVSFSLVLIALYCTALIRLAASRGDNPIGGAAWVSGRTPFQKGIR